MPKIGKIALLLGGAVLVGVLGLALRQAVQPAPIALTDDLDGGLRADTYRMVRALEERSRTEDDARTLVQLGYAYVQSARETGDGRYTERAEAAFRRVLAEDAHDADALHGLGQIYLTYHRFGEALDFGQRALAEDPHRAATFGVLVDALVELGRYDEAVAAAQTMVNLRPDQASYTRVSYLRELHGDLAGAIDAMQRAVTAGSGSQENTAWCEVYLGHLYLQRGDLAAAEAAYRAALRRWPDYGHALGALGRLARVNGQAGEAVARYEAAVETLPIPEYVIALGEAYAAAGRADEAHATIQDAIATLEAERDGGMDIDDELALLLLDHDGDPLRALALAQGAYDRRPTVKNASILAWALHRLGRFDEARRYAAESLRLGSAEALFHYRAGVIEDEAGQPAIAHAHLQRALGLNPHFAEADEARQRLAAGV